MHPLLHAPYAALGAAVEAAVGLVPGTTDAAAPKWRRALAARRGLFERLSAFGKRRDGARPLIWFHAPSAGEALQALPVHHRVRQAHDDLQTALTFFSPSAESVAQRFDAEFRDYLPFDTARGADAALDALRPAALVYSKLDVWPTLTARATLRGVPVGMISATLREGSSRRGAFASALLREAYASLDLVGAISDDDAQRLVDLGVHHARIRVTGDTRYDQVWERVQKIDRHSDLLAPLVSDRPTLIAGSTWPADEARLREAWQKVRPKTADARLIIAPHEPTEAHIAPIEKWCAAAYLSSARLGSADAPYADVIIVDRVGPLGELYTLGWCAFVGGGFHDAGLHSVLEPAAAGVPVVAGPRGAHNSDLDYLAKKAAATRVTSAEELARAIVEYVEDHRAGGQKGHAAREAIREKLGAADRAAELVTDLRSTERKHED